MADELSLNSSLSRVQRAIARVASAGTRHNLVFAVQTGSGLASSVAEQLVSPFARVMHLMGSCRREFLTKCLLTAS